jgi:hypothetical protein
MFDSAAAQDTPVAWVLTGGYTWGISMDEVVGLRLYIVLSAIGRLLDGSSP